MYLHYQYVLKDNRKREFPIHVFAHHQKLYIKQNTDLSRIINLDLSTESLIIKGSNLDYKQNAALNIITGIKSYYFTNALIFIKIKNKKIEIYIKWLKK